MKSITAILIMCFMTLTVQAQKTELLKGKWKYKDVADKEKLDSTFLKQAKMQLAKLEMEYAPDGKFLYNPLGDNPNSLFTGTWTLNKEQTKVTVQVSNTSSPEKKQTTEWEIKGLTEKELKLYMGNAVIVLGRLKTEQSIREERINEELKKKQLKFSEGLAAIGINDNWGFIDLTGKEIIPFKYTYAENFIGGIAKVRIGKYPNYKYGFIDIKGKEVIPLIYDKVGNFTDGLTSVCINDKYGFIDKTGKAIIPLIYGGTWDFREGLAMVRNGPYGIGKCGFIDKTGKEIIPLKYEQGDEGFKEGLALVVLDGKYGFIDKTGKEIIPLKYDFAFSFREGLAVVTLNKKWGVINKLGKEITPLKYDNAAKGFDGGLISVELNDIWGFIDKTGKEIIPLKYSSVGSFKEGLAVVTLNKKFGFIDKTGKEIIPLKYDNVQRGGFTEGFASVELNKKWGFIDKTGKEIIPLKYDQVSDFEDDKVKVKLNGREFYIDKSGKEVSK